MPRGRGHVIGEHEDERRVEAALRAQVHLGEALLALHDEDALGLAVLGRGGEASRLEDGLELLGLDGGGGEAALGVA